MPAWLRNMPWVDVYKRQGQRLLPAFQNKGDLISVVHQSQQNQGVTLENALFFRGFIPADCPRGSLIKNSDAIGFLGGLQLKIDVYKRQPDSLWVRCCFLPHR